jgi:hypothetical protein
MSRGASSRSPTTKRYPKMMGITVPHLHWLKLSTTLLPEEKGKASDTESTLLRKETMSMSRQSE